MVDAVPWDWSLGGRVPWVETSDGGEEAVIADIKWQIIVEKL
jgi:hypothetical protein